MVHLKKASNPFFAFYKASQVAGFQRIVGFACRPFWAASLAANQVLNQKDAVA